MWLYCFRVKAMSQNSEGREFNGKYQKEYLDKIAFPIGGIGAGMFCLEGTGAISHVSLRHHPDVMNEPYTFAAIYVKGVENGAKVLEGQVPTWKLFGPAQSGLVGETRRTVFHALKRRYSRHVSLLQL